jgi:hypothetical protein
MTHPVMWGLLNAMTGAALDLPGGTLYLAPKLFPGSDTLRLPVFFPRFWLAVEFQGSTGTGSVKVLKVIDGPPPAVRTEGSGSGAGQGRPIVLERLVLTRPDDSVKEIDLKRFVVEEDAEIEFSVL